MDWNPWHRLEYHREFGKGHTERTYTENVADQGFRLSLKGMTKEQYFAHYARVCAEDFLERQDARSGAYVVAVYDTNSAKPRALGSIRMRWR